MANPDKPGKNHPHGDPIRVKSYTAGGAIARGDLVVFSSGNVVVGSNVSGQLLGMALHAAASAERVAVADHPEQLFEMQCSGTYADSMIGTMVDLEGTTGIMEVNEDATSVNVLRVIDRIRGDVPGSIVGANTRVIVKIAKHSLASTPS